MRKSYENSYENRGFEREKKKSVQMLGFFFEIAGRWCKEKEDFSLSTRGIP